MERGEIRISLHGYDELADDHIRVRNVVDGLKDAVLLADDRTTRRALAALCCNEMERGGRFM